MSDSESNYSRRTYLKGAATASTGAMVGFAGCVGGGGSGGNGSGGNNSSGGSSGGGGKLQVLHGWTGGDGKKAINNLIEKFKQAHSDVNADFQAIGGGGNTNLDTTISNRAQNGNLLLY